MKKLLVLIASSAEWYEFTVYSFCAVYIGKAFFPDYSNPFINFLLAFGAFAAGFLARPLGGILFGYIGDNKSRTTALAWAAMLMGIPTVGMALLPSYSYIGVLAPILLVTFRILQGIAIGGQYSGSVVILIESETTALGKAKASSNVVASAFGGILLAIISFQIISYFIPDTLMENGGWRILFGVAVLLIILSYFIKHSDGDKEDTSNKRNVKLSTIFEYKSSIMFLILLCFPGAVVSYFQITILPNIITQILHNDTVNVALLTTISLIVFIVACMSASRLTKWFSIKQIITFGLVLMLITPLPMYALYKMNNDMLIVFFVFMAGIFGIFYGNIMVVFTESFPKEIRYTGFAIAYNIGFGIYGAALPFICFYSAQEISDYAAISIISLSALVGLVTLYKLQPNITKESLDKTI
jgi:MHS family proline/betaine transporter-like MFS transporter